MRIKISTDSTSDIPISLREELGIAVLPLTVIAGSDEYRDGYDITPDEFYDRLETEAKLPSSAQVNPYLYTDLYEETWKAGYTDLIHTSLNSKGSATWQNAVHMRDMFYEEHPSAKDTFRIHIIDSRNYSIGYGFAVVQAAKMAREGADADSIVASIQDWIDHVKVILVPMHLTYVKKSGRISAAAALLGEAVGLKPLILFEDGETKVISKVRGKKKVIAEMIEQCAKGRKPGTPYLIARCRGTEDFDQLRAACEAKLGEAPAMFCQLGCIISINTGPEALGIAYRV